MRTARVLIFHQGLMLTVDFFSRLDLFFLDRFDGSSLREDCGIDLGYVTMEAPPGSSKRKLYSRSKSSYKVRAQGYLLIEVLFILFELVRLGDNGLCINNLLVGRKVKRFDPALA